jgi:hypothetical protein
MESPLSPLPFLLFPIAFAALWGVVTAGLGWAAGWYALAARYPDRAEAPLATLTWESGVMGMGVNFRHILTLAPCPSGLRVAVWRSFGPWSRPFFVPWEQVKIRRARWFLMDVVELTFGAAAHGKLTVRADTAQRLAAAAGKRWPEPHAPIKR